MKIGNTSINLEALKTITKEQFIEMNRGTMLNVELEANNLNKYFKKEEESFSEESYSKKKKNRKNK